MPRFKPGKSGNPAGRPTETITQLLADVPIEDKARLSRLMWSLLLTGTITLENGKTLAVSSAVDWAKLASFLIQHLDGPAPTRGQSAETRFILTLDPEILDARTENTPAPPSSVPEDDPE